MIKCSARIAYEQNHPAGLASALIAQFVFLAKSALKMHCTKKFFRQKLLQITIRKFWCKTIFDRPMGLASALIALFDFLAKSALKCFVQTFFQTKVVTNEKPQLLCYVTSFNILSHFGVITASQICSECVKKVLCRLTEQIFHLENVGFHK